MSGKIVFISESVPGYDSSAMVRLDQFLAEVGIRRSDCHFLRLRGTAKRIDSGKRKGEVEADTLFVLSENTLYDEITVINPNVIVPLGDKALWACTRKWGIDKWRGSQLECVPQLGSRKAIPTYHPAYTLRDFLAQYPMKMDLARVKVNAEYPERRLLDRHLIINPSFDAAMAYIESCMSLPEVGFDIETKPVGGTTKEPATWEVSCFSLATSATSAICIPFLGEDGLYYSESQHRDIMVALARLLESPVVKVGQNLNFDCSFMLRKHGIYTWPIWDTMIAQRILLPDLPVGLDFITSIYTDEPYYKDEGKQWRNTTDWGQFYTYSAKDAAIVAEVKPRQLADLNRQGNLRTFERTISQMPAIAFMQERGVHCDTATLGQLKVDVQAECDAKLKQVMALVNERASTFVGKTGKERNFDDKFPSSSDQCKAYFYGVLGHPPYKKRGGGITVDDEALIRLSRKGCDEASLVLEYRKMAKLISAYLDAKLDNGRFRCQYKPVGTVTGRLSSAADIFGFGLNLQTIPREGPFKKMFLPDPGYIMVQMDLSQAEARILAHVGRVRAKVDAYAQGIDVYALTASKIAERLGHRLTPDDIMEQHEANVMAPIAGGKFTWRKIGKECDLALGYGMGADRFSRRTEMPLNDSKVVREAWHLVYPEVRHNYHAMVDAMLNKSRIVVNPFDRKRKFLGPRKEISEAAYSHFCQSTVADAMMERALAPYSDLAAQDTVELLLQVHDSVVWQMPLAAGWQAIAAAIGRWKDSMEQPIEWQGSSFVIPVSVGVSGKSLGHVVEIGTGAITPEIVEQAYQKSVA